MDLLKHLFSKVETLEDFIKGFPSVTFSKPLIVDNDKELYVRLVKETVVCATRDARPCPSHITCERVSTQEDILQRVAERLCLREKFGTNLLTVGFSLRTNNPHAQQSTTRKLESTFVNTSSSQFLLTKWKTVLERVGDGVMEFLLEHRSVFMLAVPPGCYVQLSGVPVYKLKSFSQRYIKTRRKVSGCKHSHVKLKSSIKHGKLKRKRNKIKLWRERNVSKIRHAAVSGADCKEIKKSVRRAGECEDDIKAVGSINEQYKDMKICGMKRRNSDGSETSPIVAPKRCKTSCDKVTSECRSTIVVSEPVEYSSDVPVCGRDVGIQPCNAESPGSSVRGLSTEPCNFGAPDSSVRGLSIEPCSVGSPESFVSFERTDIVSDLSFISVESTVSELDEVGLRCQQNERHNEHGHCGTDLPEALRDPSDPISVGKPCEPVNVGKPKGRRRKRKKFPKDAIERVIRNAFDPRIILNTRKMYFTNSAEKCQPQHVFPRMQNNETAANALLEQVLSVNVTSEDETGRTIGLPNSAKCKLREMLTKIILKHFKCQYIYLLNFFTRSDCAKDCLQGTVPLLAKPADSIHPQKVFLFIRTCVLRIFQMDFFGNTHNRNVFLKNCKSLISLGLNDRFSLGQMMIGMQPKSAWGSELSSNGERLWLFAKCIRWIIDFYVVPLIKSYFYVTNSSIGKNGMCYFRADSWSDMCERHIKEEKGFESITRERAEQKVAARESLGIGFLRFIPKDNGKLRPIINLSRKQTIPGVFSSASINSQLKDSLKFLTKEVERNPKSIGSAKTSLNKIKDAMKGFILNPRKTSDARGLYCVSVDVKNCFDSIDQSKLAGILDSQLDLAIQSGRQCLLRAYSSVQITGGQITRKFSQPVSTAGEYIPNFITFVKSIAERERLTSCVLIDECMNFTIDAAAVRDRLLMLIYGTVVRFGQCYYALRSGIAQGSVVSSLLCNLYYGDMEKKYFDWMSNDELLMRQVDDFIYLTLRRGNAERFLELMTRGMKEYNCVIKKEKSVVNFEYADVKIKRLHNSEFPWVGLLIDTVTLQVRPDLSRCIGAAIHSSVSIDISQNAGRSLLSRLLFSLRVACHTIYLDPTINSPNVVLENMFKVFSLQALKFCYLVSELPVKESVKKNPVYFVRVVESCGGYVWKQLALLGYPIGGLDEVCVKWVCFRAFVLKLSQNKSIYKAVCKILRGKCRGIETKRPDLVCGLGKEVGNVQPVELCFTSE